MGMHAHAENDAVNAYIMSKKVIVHKDKAELCFADDKQCHPVLVGKTTPRGTFDLTLMKTEKPGYGGEVIGFKQDKDFLFALHRVWTRIPAERRLERIASPLVADRIMTNGCINVTNPVYDKLRNYFVLEVI
ncbi:murein L,D-transpeptidase [Neisseria sp. ZJ106]|uniref:Murein L,D-transpeptidase n=1 Tax=Neisseria lisongii TaxID=2912188 RepID=A0AAW5AQG6_9NEIS|nr:murein L,D-transpeptidase [Neisseria lisongii]MCF7522203.1 murein L,D-transpeptidase [Neisseria lisongii]MCF7530510.1 murein L,D-transpeptidase [Neisseria lisongii]WCL72498.1 murein L,D-transpeptidase [Neisseria lisongii]